MASIFNEHHNTLLNGLSTTKEWQENPSQMAILGIGACEQHGHHMPLLTDTLSADYIAHHLGDAFGAPVLPTIPIGTSMEHAGYRGSFSFRPETMMAIIRDLTDECEQQNFTRLVVLNGHGGNFSLGPVVRDINRTDRKIKVILINSFMLDSSQSKKACDEKGLEIHAGCTETSRLMFTFPNHIKEIPNYDRSDDIKDATQNDLNMSGIGTLRPSGIWGEAKGADAKKGKDMMNSIEKNIIIELQKQLDRLEKEPRYGGNPNIQA